MGDAQSSALVAVSEMNAKMLAVGEKLHHVPNALAADDDHDLSNAHPRQCGDGVIDHRPVVDRQEVLVGYDGEGE
jgi:hypothetical protein